jgi:hypothetical protein
MPNSGGAVTGATLQRGQEFFLLLGLTTQLFLQGRDSGLGDLFSSLQDAEMRACLHTFMACESRRLCTLLVRLNQGIVGVLERRGSGAGFGSLTLRRQVITSRTLPHLPLVKKKARSARQRPRDRLRIRGPENESLVRGVFPSLGRRHTTYRQLLAHDRKLVEVDPQHLPSRIAFLTELPTQGLGVDTFVEIVQGRLDAWLAVEAR